MKRDLQPDIEDITRLMTINPIIFHDEGTLVWCYISQYRETTDNGLNAGQEKRIGAFINGKMVKRYNRRKASLER